jgi:hypothetical protein
MKSYLWLLLGVLAVVALGGCFSKPPKEVFHEGDEVPPEFITGAAGMFLTNLDGFSASVAASVPGPGGVPKTVSGDLLEREGRLIFQPASQAKIKKDMLQGGMIFIWDESSHFGYVLSDPLQAYARYSTGIQYTNLSWKTEGAVEEQLNGHPCRRLEAVVESDDGLSSRFTVWQAEDAKRLPIRIQSTSGSRPITVDFTNIRLDLPPPELFVPPDGYSKYPTTVALMNELIVRQTELIKEDNRSVTPAGTLPNTWRTGAAQ